MACWEKEESEGWMSLPWEKREGQREKSEGEIETERGTETGIGSVVTEIKIETETGTEKGGGTETETENASISGTGVIESVERIDTALCFPLWVRMKAWGMEKKEMSLSCHKWRKVHRMG